MRVLLVLCFGAVAGDVVLGLAFGGAGVVVVVVLTAGAGDLLRKHGGSMCVVFECVRDCVCVFV